MIAFDPLAMQLLCRQSDALNARAIRHEINETQENRYSGAGQILAVVREEGNKSGSETARNSRRNYNGVEEINPERNYGGQRP
jgi:hypothetical protein